MSIDGANAIHSVAGSRGYVRVGLVEVIPRYSVGSISLGNSGTSHNFSRTWWISQDFDKAASPEYAYMLPCETASFNLGEDLYKAADDAVPGAMRLKALRCGSYIFKIAFPILITNNNAITGERSEIANAYEVIKTFIQKANCMASLNTSIQHRYYPCVLDNFNISVNGYGGVNPVSCSLTTKGLGINPNLEQDPFRRSIITNTTRRDKETRDGKSPPDIKGDALSYGGRLANIKDCALSLNSVNYQQIISMELNIQHEIQLASTAGLEPISNTSTIVSADRIFLKERKVTGKFQFLSSYASAIDLAALAPPDPAVYSLEGGAQWASPLYMAFGPDMIFDMPAVYWQPRIEEFSTGSPLITINFVARSNLTGTNEFMSGL